MILRRFSHAHRLATAIAVLGSLLAPALTASAAAGSATTTAVPACAGGGLVVWLNTQGNGTAGSIYYTLYFTNLASHACTLRGYPGVSATSLGGSKLGSPATRIPSTLKTVTIAAGRSARATLRVVDVGVLSPSVCHPTTAAGLRVYPPNQAAAKLIPFPFPACSRSGPMFLGVGRVTK